MPRFPSNPTNPSQSSFLVNFSPYSQGLHTFFQWSTIFILQQKNIKYYILNLCGPPKKYQYTTVFQLIFVKT